MKLPSRVRTGVQSLGRQDINAPIRQANAVAGAIGTLTSGLQQAQVAIDARAEEERIDKINAQTREASLRYSDGAVQFEQHYGNRETFDASELPSNIQVRRTEKVTAPDGTISEIPRAAIPAYEVKAALYETYSRNVAEASASLIDDDEAKAEWLAKANMAIDGNYISRLESDRKDQEIFIEAQLNVQINSSLEANQYDTALVLADDIKDPEKKAAAKRQIKRTRELDAYHGLLADETDDIGTVREMEKVIHDLQDPEFNSNLSPQERSAMVAQMKAATARNYMSIEATKQRNKEEVVSVTWEGIIKNDPTINENRVDALFDKGIINGNTRTSMIRALVSNREAAIKEQVVSIDLDTVALSPYGIDPKDKDMRKAVDKRFESYTQNMDAGEAATQIMREFKVVPSQVQAIFRANNRADAQGLADAANMYRDAMKFAPQSMKDFSDSDLDVISRVAANMDLGMPAGDAIEAVRYWEAMTPQQKAALEKNSRVFEEDNIKALDDKVGDSELYQGGGIFGFFQGTPDIPPLMQTEYSSAVEKYLPSAGYNTAVAQQLAFNDMSKRWHRTEVNGRPQMMKNAPEGPVESVRAMIRQQYTGSLARVRETYGGNIKYDDIQLASDQLTALEIEAGKTPTYRVYVVVDKDTQQIEFLERFSWDSNKAAEARRDEILKEAQAARQESQLRQEFEDPTMGAGLGRGNVYGY
ncbi:structural protein [Alteromonas phage ZP6]|uniref:Structural protein n=1 Tax=Alteromonas phage ZP6 TaxID=2492447 RepID=A0A3S9U8B2_9CAUD|nr:structural protein [Alteromonas phage ZP6]AZS06564.1 structural protein [Alteromonas phage ZP6]